MLTSKQSSVDEALACLDKFCMTSSSVVNVHKIDHWIVGLDDAPSDWISSVWTYIWFGVVVKYLGICFGVGLSPVAMWDCCLQWLQSSVVRLGLEKYSAGLGLGNPVDLDKTRIRLIKYEKK